MKYETLEDFLNATADAVRSKTKNTKKINAQNIPKAIEDIFIPEPEDVIVSKNKPLYRITTSNNTEEEASLIIKDLTDISIPDVEVKFSDILSRAYMKDQFRITYMLTTSGYSWDIICNTGYAVYNYETCLYDYWDSKTLNAQKTDIIDVAICTHDGYQLVDKKFMDDVCIALREKTGDDKDCAYKDIPSKIQHLQNLYKPVYYIMDFESNPNDRYKDRLQYYFSSIPTNNYIKKDTGYTFKCLKDCQAIIFMRAYNTQTSTSPYGSVVLNVTGYEPKTIQMSSGSTTYAIASNSVYNLKSGDSFYFKKGSSAGYIGLHIYIAIIESEWFDIETPVKQEDITDALKEVYGE